MCIRDRKISTPLVAPLKVLRPSIHIQGPSAVRRERRMTASRRRRQQEGRMGRHGGRVTGSLAAILLDVMLHLLILSHFDRIEKLRASLPLAYEWGPR